jgi:hypothetical protein
MRGPVVWRGGGEDEATCCSPTFAAACRSSFSAFITDPAPPPCSASSSALGGSGFSFGEPCEPLDGGGGGFPMPVASMPSFSFFCARDNNEPAEPQPVAASSSPMTARVSTPRGVNGRRNHTIGGGGREHLDVAVSESFIRWASCTNFSTTPSLRASLVC